MNNLQITDDNRRRGFMKILSTVGMGLGISSVGFAQNQSADGQSENLIKKGKVNSTGGYFNVKDFGATGNRDVRDIGAIQEAVKKCKESGGGTIYFPPGIYISGTIWLYDDMTVHIDSGAVILESYIEGMETIGKYRPHLICADGAKNVAVIGFGSVKGQGEKMTHNSLQKERGFRSGMLFFQNCTNVKIRDINIFDSDSWTVHLKGCKQVFIDSISIKNDINRKTSNDGIDINACKYVHISNCHIITSDDCIVLKTNDLTFPDCENIVVNNCTLETLCSAIKIGSETRRNFRDIVFSNCVIKNTSQGISMY
ncbi:MAG: hypothetical protein C0433_19680, partial [Cyclobacterium sp.]|nr:hypothetical protein [Cyclobacterium sp.]